MLMENYAYVPADITVKLKRCSFDMNSGLKTSLTIIIGNSDRYQRFFNSFSYRMTKPQFSEIAH